MVTAERRAQEQELRSQGYTTEILKTWQPKVDMWRHTPGMSMDGIEIFPVDTPLPGQTTLWDQQVRLSRRGFLPWQPGEECIKLHNGGCKACRGAFGMVEEIAETLIEEIFPPAEVSEVFQAAPLKDYPHRYGETMGSECSIPGCPAVRTTVLKHRKGKKGK